MPDGAGRGRADDRGQGRSRLHGGDRDPAGDRARRLQGHRARTAQSPRSPTPRSTRRCKRIAEQSRPFAAKGEGAKAESGDRVTIDFTGKIDGTPFEGGTGGDVVVHLGSGTFIPGFEDQLIGIGGGRAAHGQRDLPADLSGGASRRQGGRVRRHRRSRSRRRSAVTIDDEFAKSLGLESLAKLKDDGQGAAGARARRRCRARSSSASCSTSSTHAQVRAAADAGRGRVQQRLEDHRSTTCRRRSAPSRTKTPPRRRRKEEYRGIAERRVRLGLVLAEIGERNNIKVTDEELQPRA